MSLDNSPQFPGRPVRAGRLVCVVGALAVALAPAAAAAQTAARTLTLDEALQLAESTSEQVAIARADVTRAEAGRQLARSERLPQLNGAASYDRTLKSEFEGLFDTAPDPGEGVDFGELPFGQANVYRLGLSFSQLLYAGGRVRAQERQAELQRNNAQLSLASARAQTTLDVAEAFYDAALADRIVEIAEAAYEQADRALRVTEQQRTAGRVSEFELLRARVARDSLQPSVVRARNAREVAYLRLKQLLDLPLGEPLQLVADLEDATLPPPPRFAEALAVAAAESARSRLAVEQTGNQVGIAEQAAAIARAGRRPTVALRSDYGLVDYPSGLPDFTDWRQNWTVGVGVTVPVFNGGRIRANEAIARAGVEQARAELRLTEELAALDEASTRQDVEAARAEWEASAATIQQAQRAYEIAELRYREGLSTQLELSDARLQLAQALATRAEAARNLQVRRIRLALLPELPLGAGFAAASAAAGSGAQSAQGTAAPAAVPAQSQPAAQTTPGTGAAGFTSGPGGR
ncbi:MAG TPA: TolC family protein [Vicinamibacterales bacterium]